MFLGRNDPSVQLFIRVLSNIASITRQAEASRGVPIGAELARPTARRNLRAFEIAEDARACAREQLRRGSGGSGHDASIYAPRFPPRVPEPLYSRSTDLALLVD